MAGNDDGNDDGNGNGNGNENDDNYYYGTDVSFDSYEVTTINPGGYLLVITFFLSALSFVIGYFALPGKFLHPLSEGLQRSLRRLSPRDANSFRIIEENESDISFEDDGIELAKSRNRKSNVNNEPLCDYEEMSENESVVGSDDASSPQHYEEMGEDESKSTSEGMSSSSQEAIELSDYWKKSVDKETGKPFYYNDVTLSSTWTKPEALSKRNTDKCRRSQILQGRRLKAQSERVFATTEKVHMQNLSRERSVVRRTTRSSRRFHQEDKSVLLWTDFVRVFEFEEKDRPQSAPSRVMDTPCGGYESFFDEFVDNPELSVENNMKKRVWKETRKIFQLGLPWMFQSLIADGSSIVSIMIISHYMGLREMICYSNVWFIVYSVFLINDAWYDTVYKHVNVSAAVGTNEAYHTAGKYVKIGVWGNFMIALPLSIVSIVYMPAILTWIGYDESISAISQSYAAIAVVNNLFDTSTGIIDCVLDIEGHAKFTAIFEFWDSLVFTSLEFFFVKKYRPTLFQVGLFHFACDIIATGIYFIITGYFKGWFDSYREGMWSPINSVSMEQVKKLGKMTVPLTMETLMGNVEYTVLTIFAAYQGTAEAATWVLLSYVWDAVGIAPDSFGAAASCHVARILGKGEGKLAERVSWHSIKVGTAISILFSIALLLSRRQFVWLFSLDDTIERMLSELIPYITICQPFFTIGWTAMELNDALHLFKRAMVSNAIVTIFIILPVGYIMTYVLHYNLEGIACAQCIGYTAGGVANVVFLAKADWGKAVEKANAITDVLKKDLDIEEEPVGHYDEYSWEDMPIEARAAATCLGYDQNKWDNALPTAIVDYDNFTSSQLSSAEIMGYTREMYKSSIL